MRRRRLLISVGLVVGFAALVLVGLAAAVERQPSFYRQADMPAGPQRARQSQEAVANYWRATNVIDDPSWQVTFSADQVNAFFQDEAFENAGGDNNLPDGFHAPRVKIEDGKLRIGARYDTGMGSTVVSLEIRLWKVPDDLNTLAMEIVSLHAGALPLPTGMLLDRLSEAARRQYIDISWYRQDGPPVAIMRFQAHLSRPTFQFDQIELANGRLTISGRSTDVITTPAPRVVGP
jgi:hypothetical protein